MIILGIDPGTASTGYGAIKGAKGCFEFLGCGVIKTTPDQKTGERLKIINSELGRIIKEYQPRVLVMERLYFFKNFKTVIPVSQAGGVILFTAAQKKIEVVEFTPLQAKLAITGFGFAKKDAVQERIKKILRLKEIPKPDDAADGLAMALSYFMVKKKPLTASKKNI